MHALSAERNMPRFPRRETLADFFRMDHRQRVRVPELARLLDVAEHQVREILRAEAVDWGEAAACLFDAWPRARILAALGPELARRIPAAFHPIPVQ